MNTNIIQYYFQAKKKYNRWGLLAILLVAFIALPILTIILSLFEGPGKNWQHLANTVLVDYVLNSAVLVVGTGIISLIFGISTAWIVSTCEFPGRKFFEWALILPLALPTYIVAYVYAGITDFTGPIQTLLRNTLDFSAKSASLDIMNIWGAMFIMAAVLYPYVYVISRTSFLSQSKSLLESSRILGSGPWRTFFKVALPVTRPAFVGGLLLVVMEVLNDYGAVKYYGVSTFTTGIFRAWFSLGDANAAIYLSALLMLFVFLLISLERAQRGRRRFHSGESVTRPIKRYQPAGIQTFACFLVCLFPFLIGFAIPVAQLLYWSYLTAAKVLNFEFVTLIINSFTLASVSALIIVVFSFLLIYASRINQTSLIRNVNKIAILGYSIPGAVIAVGILISLLGIDKDIVNLAKSHFSYTGGLILTGTISGLLFAYLVRFMAVGYSPIEAETKKLSPFLIEASRSLGMTPGKTLFKIELPLLKKAMLSAALLVFVDVLKELPLTLILRPFNYHTLATKTFELAGDEMIAESSNAALIIIATGIVPIILLNKLITNKGKKRAETTRDL